MTTGARHHSLGHHKNIGPVDTLEPPSQWHGDKELHREDDQPALQARSHDRHRQMDIPLQHAAQDLKLDSGDNAADCALCRVAGRGGTRSNESGHSESVHSSANPSSAPCLCPQVLDSNSKVLLHDLLCDLIRGQSDSPATWQGHRRRSIAQLFTVESSRVVAKFRVSSRYVRRTITAGGVCRFRDLWRNTWPRDNRGMDLRGLPRGFVNFDPGSPPRSTDG